jgi:hypothetical protein
MKLAALQKYFAGSELYYSTNKDWQAGWGGKRVRIPKGGPKPPRYDGWHGTQGKVALEVASWSHVGNGERERVWQLQNVMLSGIHGPYVVCHSRIAERREASKKAARRNLEVREAFYAKKAELEPRLKALFPHCGMHYYDDRSWETDPYIVTLRRSDVERILAVFEEKAQH